MECNIATTVTFTVNNIELRAAAASSLAGSTRVVLASSLLLNALLKSGLAFLLSPTQPKGSLAKTGSADVG